LKKILIIIFVFSLYPNISSAKTSTKSSAKMHQYCKLWIKKNDGQSLSQINLTKGLACSWYFKGMFDSSVFVQVMNNIKSGQSASSIRQARLNGMCAPKNISTGQWIRVFVKYLDDNPQNLNRSASLNSSAALKKYYRCKR
tara:strand:- start:442 stop:864 length:423 start_codon:yes stop_codon:yes gene_type:complete